MIKPIFVMNRIMDGVNKIKIISKIIEMINGVRQTIITIMDGMNKIIKITTMDGGDHNKYFIDI
jgi:hypothetical protein